MDLSPGPLRELGARAESLGYDSIWTAEAWGRDAFMPLAYLAASTSRIKLGTAIAQMAARTPATTAMTALTLQQLSEGRLLLGLGLSGPQVVEGWHGVPFRAPLATSRDYVAILRQALAADAKVEYQGDVYSVPFKGEGSTGQGRPLRSTMPGAPETPIMLAALGPKNTKLATEVADGLLPYLWSPHHWQAVWGDALATVKADFRVAPTVIAAVGADIAECRDVVRPRIALHVGGMGSKDQNFYKSLVERYGYEAEAETIQDLYLSGDRAGATAAVSDALVDELALVGPTGHIAEQLEAWRKCPIETLIVEAIGDGALEQIAAIWS
jgi:F420-dependent oxidoreductase-like protein